MKGYIVGRWDYNVCTLLSCNQNHYSHVALHAHATSGDMTLVYKNNNNLGVYNWWFPLFGFLFPLTMYHTAKRTAFSSLCIVGIMKVLHYPQTNLDAHHFGCFRIYMRPAEGLNSELEQSVLKCHDYPDLFWDTASLMVSTMHNDVQFYISFCILFDSLLYLI